MKGGPKMIIKMLFLAVYLIMIELTNYDNEYLITIMTKL